MALRREASGSDGMAEEAAALASDSSPLPAQSCSGRRDRHARWIESHLVGQLIVPVANL
jgi:hypothetical protein